MCLGISFHRSFEDNVIVVARLGSITIRLIIVRTAVICKKNEMIIGFFARISCSPSDGADPSSSCNRCRPPDVRN